MSYCVFGDVLDQTINAAITQAGWANSDITNRIAEGDATIDGLMAAAGYAVPFSTTPALIKQLSILHAKYAVLRDIYQGNAPSQSDGGGFQMFKDRFDELTLDIIEGRVHLIDPSSGNTLSRSRQFQTTNATAGIPPFFTVDDPENLSNEPDPSYIDLSLTDP